MKTVKKVLGVVLILAMVFAISACGEKPMDIYKTANDNFAKAKDVSMKSEGTVKAGISGTSIEIPVTLDMQMVKKGAADSKDLKDYDLSMVMTGKYNGTTVAVNVYMTGGYMYMEVAGQKTKMSLADATKSTKGLTDSMDAKKSYKAFEDSVTESDKSGDEITIKLDGDKYIKALVDQAASASTSSDAATASDTIAKALKCGNIDIKCTVENDQFKTYNIKMAPEITYQNQAVTLDVSFDSTIEKIDSGLKINFPDFKDYKEQTTTNNNVTNNLM